MLNASPVAFSVCLPSCVPCVPPLLRIPVPFSLLCTVKTSLVFIWNATFAALTYKEAASGNYTGFDTDSVGSYRSSQMRVWSACPMSHGHHGLCDAASDSHVACVGGMIPMHAQ